MSKSHTGIDHRHCKWPLGQRVATHIGQWYVEGKITKHDPGLRHSCWIDFDVEVDRGDANGKRFAHIIPFRCMKKIAPIIPREKLPWYKKGVWRKLP